MNSSISLATFCPSAPDDAGVLTWLHLGYLHMTCAGERNHLDLAALVDEINAVFANSISFVYLPGDVADDGSRAAYAVVRNELDRLHAPWCAIVGDHDVHEKRFTNFLAAMAGRTHYAFTTGNFRFVAMNAFDVPDPGSFFVSDDQQAWVKRELQDAASKGLGSVLLLHCYPSDLKIGASELHEIVRNFGVRVVDMGHTHYNELSNDGHTIYTATRSTGQIEEGNVGFSVINLDNGIVSWRFFELNQLPAVMITSPSDERLLITATPSASDKTVRAKIWSDAEIVRVSADFNGQHLTLRRIGQSKVWQSALDTHTLADGIYPLTVTAEDASGKRSEDSIRIAVGDTVQQRERVARDQDNALEAWPEHGLLATQLGPNKNGKKW